VKEAGRRAPIREVAVIRIDEDLLNEALRLGGQRTKRATVTQAREEYVSNSG
jgi:Arc/MetJ family transcription regulator